MDKINGKKLLLPSNSSSSQKKLNSYQLVPYKNINTSSKKISEKDESVKKGKTETVLGNVIHIKVQLIKAEKLFKNRNSSLLKNQKTIEKEYKDKKRKEREEELESKKANKEKVKGEDPQPPQKGIVDYIKNFLKWVIIGRAFMLFSKHIPSIISFAKNLKPLYDFFKTLAGALFNGLVTFIEWTDKAGKKVREIVGSLGGEPFQKAFDTFSGALTTFMNLALIAGMATMGGSDLGVGDALDKVSPDSTRKPPRKPQGRRPGGKPRITTSGGRRLGGTNLRNPLRQRPTITTSGGVPAPKPKITGSSAAGAGKLGAKTLLKSLRPLLRGMIIGGLIDFGLSVALGENPGRAAFGAVGATLLGVIGGALGGPFAAFTAIGGGMLGDWAGRKLYDVFFGNKPPSKSAPQKKNKGGTIKTRNGKVINRPKRSIPGSRGAKKPSVLPIKKIQPGKNVGGENQIKKLFPDPSKKLSKNEWIQGNYAGTYEQYERQFQRRKNRPNAFKALVDIGSSLSTTPFLGRILQAPIKVALGEQPDKFAFKSFSDGVSYIINTLTSNQINDSMAILRNSIRAFAEGGEVPTRELVSMRRKDYGNIFERIIGGDIEKSFNKSLEVIRKEVNRKGKKETERERDGQDGGGGADSNVPGARLRDGSNAQIEADLLEYFTALYGKNAAIGIVANLRRESGYRTRTPDNSLYEGMAQWSRDDRWPKFEKWATDKGLDPYSRDAQAQYVAVELKQLGTDKRIKLAKTPEEAASIFYNEFERGAYSRPVRGNSYNPDNPHENKNKDFIKDITKSNPDIGKRADKVIISPTTSPEAMVTGGVKPSEIELTSGQGYREHPITGQMKYHAGIDLVGAHKSPISSAQDAKVVHAGWLNDGYGNSVILRYSDGAETRFAHLDSVNVKTGQSIKAGQMIGRQGSTGLSTGSHLHFEYYPKGGAMSYKGYGDAASVKDSYFRYGGNVKAKISNKPMQPPQLSSGTEPNIINASGMALSSTYQTIQNLKPGQKIVFNNVGNIQRGKNFFGQSVIKYYDTSGKEISQNQFDKVLKNSKVLEQMKANDRQLQNMQGGGYLDMNYKNVKKPSGIINNYSEDDDMGTTTLIQPVYVYIKQPNQNGGLQFPGSFSLNSNEISMNYPELSR